MPREVRRRGFTIVELLVVVAIIALLIGILLPAIGRARDQARLTASQSNLAQLARAHASYAAEWNDRQLTLAADDLSLYGSNIYQAFAEFHAKHGGCGGPTDGGCHPGLILGWGNTPENYNSENRLFGYWMNLAGNYGMVLPIGFGTTGFYSGFGSFRIPNCHQFATYVSGRFYDPVFFAPKDSIVMDAIVPCMEDPGEFSAICHEENPYNQPYWASYCLSPAAMYSPAVLRAEDRGGFQDPWQLMGGFRSPSMSNARFPDLKTMMIEHHWLQNRRTECNPGFDVGSYNGCEPYYFNLGYESSPMAMFYDGHVGSLSVARAIRADQRAKHGGGVGLWSRDTPFGEEGYYQQLSYDEPTEPGEGTSFHILTTDGILGRDTF